MPEQWRDNQQKGPLMIADRDSNLLQGTCPVGNKLVSQKHNIAFATKFNSFAAATGSFSLPLQKA